MATTITENTKFNISEVIDTQDMEASEHGLLDQLFATARVDDSSELNLDDENFTKMVVNSLPKNHRRASAKKYYPDLIGLVIGLVATFFVIEPSQIFNRILYLLPSSISISLSSMLMASFIFSCMACIAWWSVEKTQSNW